jgi:hypothetical protein
MMDCTTFMDGSLYHQKNPTKENSHVALTMMVLGYNTEFGAMGEHVNCVEVGTWWELGVSDGFEEIQMSRATRRERKDGEDG